MEGWREEEYISRNTVSRSEFCERKEQSMVGGPSLGLGGWGTKGKSSSHNREKQAIASRLPRTPAADT